MKRDFAKLLCRQAPGRLRNIDIAAFLYPETFAEITPFSPA